MTVTTTLPIDRLGPPGVPGHLVIVDKLEGDKRTDDEQLHDKSERLFHVAAILSKAPLVDENIDLAIDAERGASYVNAHEDAVTSLVKTSFGQISFSHNSRRELAKIDFDCAAHSIDEALQTFHTAVSPFLNHISYVANVPLYLARTECYDHKNHVHGYNYTNPHPHVTLNAHAATIFNRILPLYALYREAKNATSSFYKFLCYYKILEGAYAHIRPAFFSDAKAKGIAVATEKETVPAHDELKITRPDLIGKPIKGVFDTRFTPEFRDAVAHYLLSDGAILDVSDFQTLKRFGDELFVIELCARIVIEVQERYEAQLLGARA